MIQYKCIYCNGILKKCDKEMICSSCNSKFRIDDDIIILNKNTNYYGDLPENEMKELLEEMSLIDWKELVYEKFAKDRPFLYQIIMDSNRADWQYLIPLNKDSLVLDIGAGWGTISIPLASRSKVVALDGTYDRLNFVKKRAQQEKCKNIIEFVNANVLELPFDKQQFDLVVMNGVLEWVGASVEQGDPYELQMQALKNIFSILKDDGYLYIGIENMYGYKYLIGAEDDHTLLPDICYLDRNKANEYSYKVMQRPYRTYTHDKSEYEKMLKMIGFEKVDFYYPYPDYKSMNAIMELDSKVINYFNENIEKKLDIKDFNGRTQQFEKIAAKTSTIENFVSSYGIIAKKVIKND